MYEIIFIIANILKDAAGKDEKIEATKPLSHAAQKNLETILCQRLSTFCETITDLVVANSAALSCLQSNIVELFNNARSARATELIITILKSNSEIEIQVQDNGNGISPNAFDKEILKGKNTADEKRQAKLERIQKHIVDKQLFDYTLLTEGQGKIISSKPLDSTGGQGIGLANASSVLTLLGGKLLIGNKPGAGVGAIIKLISPISVIQPDKKEEDAKTSTLNSSHLSSTTTQLKNESPLLGTNPDGSFKIVNAFSIADGEGIECTPEPELSSELSSTLSPLMATATIQTAVTAAATQISDPAQPVIFSPQSSPAATSPRAPQFILPRLPFLSTPKSGPVDRKSSNLIIHSTFSKSPSKKRASSSHGSETVGLTDLISPKKIKTVSGEN